MVSHEGVVCHGESSTICETVVSGVGWKTACLRSPFWRLVLEGGYCNEQGLGAGSATCDLKIECQVDVESLGPSYLARW